MKIVPAEGIEHTETLRSGELGACWKQSVQSVRGRLRGVGDEAEDGYGEVSCI